MGIHILDIVLSCFINKLNSLIDWHPLHFPSFLRLKSTLLFSAINNMNFQSAARHRKELKMLHTIAAIWHTRHCRSEGRVVSDVTRYSFFFSCGTNSISLPNRPKSQRRSTQGPLQGGRLVCPGVDVWVKNLVCNTVNSHGNTCWTISSSPLEMLVQHPFISLGFCSNFISTWVTLFSPNLLICPQTSLLWLLQIFS